MTTLSLGIDIGGTLVKGVVIDDHQVRHRIQQDLPSDDNWQQVVRELYRELKQLAKQPITALGLSAPGLADEENRSIVCMPGRLQGLEHFDWESYLEQKVRVLNDAHAALWAEAQWGTGKGTANIVMLTLGTGVGGGLLLNGQLYQGAMQRAGHLGHVTVDASTEIADITGVSGSLEDAIGEASLPMRSRERYDHTQELVQAFMEGDTWATFVWLSSLRKLALAIASFCNAFSPDLVILAGGISKAGDSLLIPLREFLDLYEWRPHGNITPVKLAVFQEYAGAIGAALYAREQIQPGKD